MGRFLEADVLKALKRWLEPLTDRSLPNATLRERVFNLLMKLPIVAGNYLDKLKSSEIGRAVMFYNKFADEAPANRKLTSVLIERWTRLVLDLDNNYAARDDGDDDDDEDPNAGYGEEGDDAG